MKPGMEMDTTMEVISSYQAPACVNLIIYSFIASVRLQSSFQESFFYTFWKHFSSTSTFHPQLDQGI